MIPLAAWLTRVLGLRTLLLMCAGLFTVFSMVCGAAHDLPTMILGRVGQRFFGGALIPTAQTIVRTRLPPRQLPIGMTIFGLIVLLGPLVGPVLGGWLTENVDWRWCFFLNLPISAGLAVLLLLGLPHQRSRIDELVSADWLGILGMTTGLSCLTVVLEEGQRDRWFESGGIVALTVASVCGFVALAVAQVTAKRPVIKLRLMLNRSYASVILIVVVIGMVLYGILYVLPQFLSLISGYNAQQSGQVLFLSGIPAILMMPALPFMLGKLNAKVLVTIGIACFATSCFIDTALTADSDGSDFVASQLLRGVGQILAFMPLNQASVGAVGREDAADAAGLYNMARNLGGSIGLALLGVFIDRRVGSHYESITSAVTADSTLVQERLAQQAAGYSAMGADAGQGRMQAMAGLSATISRQALVITYSECFWVLGVALLFMLPLVLLLRAPRARRRPPGGGGPLTRPAVTASRLTAAGLFTAMALQGCVVGPNYAGPPAVAPQAQGAAAFRRAGDASPAAPPVAWWTALNDAELDRLMTAALKDAPDLEVARARILQSRANLKAARADRLPSIQATSIYLRTKGANSLLAGGGAASAVTGSSTGAVVDSTGSERDIEFLNVGGAATWEPDLFGGRARAVEGARAQAEAYRADLDAATVSLTAEVADAYVRLRDAQTRLDLSRAAAELQRRAVEAAGLRRRGGTASDLDVERLTSLLQSTRAEFTPLQAQVAEQMDRLATLVGREPGTLDVALAASAPPPPPPQTVTVGDPARLLRRRPDIRAAERRIAVANALVGQRTADLFPKVTLLGNLGFGSATATDLLSGDSFTYAVAPILQWRPFDFGRTRASIDNARGQADEAAAQYRRTVLAALRDAETSLSTYARQRDRVRSLTAVQATADHVSRLTALRVAGGTATTLDQIDAEERRADAQVGVAQARAQLTLDFIALQKSLGLGWDESGLHGDP